MGLFYFVVCCHAYWVSHLQDEGVADDIWAGSIVMSPLRSSKDVTIAEFDHLAGAIWRNGYVLTQQHAAVVAKKEALVAQVQPSTKCLNFCHGIALMSFQMSRPQKDSERPVESTPNSLEILKVGH